MAAPKRRKRRSEALRCEYDFAALPGGVRGKYLRRASAGTNLVLLERDVARTFRDSRSVNQALRLLADLARGTVDAGRATRTKDG
jgi:hypothetical protein